MSVEHVERVYNTYSSVYDLIFGKVFEGGRLRAPDLLNLYSDAQLLEVGAGTGLSIAEMPEDIRITGIDLSRKMLDQAHKRMAKNGRTDVRLLKMDATRLEFPDDSFDRVLAAYFVSTVPEPVKVLREMKRVCKPGGIILVMNHFTHEVPLVGPLERLFSPLFYRIGFRTDLRLRPVMEEAGLEIDRIEKIDFLGHWKAVRCFNRK